MIDDRFKQMAPHIRAAIAPHMRDLIEIADQARRMSFYQQFIVAKSPAFDRSCDDLVARIDAAIAGALAGLLSPPTLPSQRAHPLSTQEKTTKPARSIGKSRNARLAQARKAMVGLTTLLDQVRGTPHSEAILDPDFWNSGRVFAGQVAQCFNEANAHNNDLVGEGVEFNDDEYEASQ